MTEFNVSLLEEAKIVAINNNCFKSHGAKWPLEFIGVICCTEPALTEAVYILYIHIITFTMNLADPAWRQVRIPPP
jgi:hypothetical protein